MKELYIFYSSGAYGEVRFYGYMEYNEVEALEYLRQLKAENAGVDDYITMDTVHQV